MPRASNTRACTSAARSCTRSNTPASSSGAAEIREFEAAREALFENEVAREFLAAQQELERLQKEIGKYVGMTLELGRVPTDGGNRRSQRRRLLRGGGGGGCGC